MDYIREKRVEKYLRGKVLSLGLLYLKFLPDLDPGMPDRIITLPESRVVWVELKRPKGGRVAELQKYRHRQLREQGHQVEIVWSEEDADALARKIAQYL